MTPASVLLSPKPLFAQIIFCSVLFLIGADTNLLLSVILMTVFALSLHCANFMLHDTEYQALCLDCDITRKDIFGRSCILIFDSLLMMALIASAGVSLSWNKYLLAGAALFVVLPLWVMYQSRHTYHPAVAQPGFHPEHWFPPIMLLLTLLMLIPQEAIITPDGLQPFTFLILLSSIAVNLRRQTTLLRFAAKVRYVTLAGSLILLIWNYLHIA